MPLVLELGSIHDPATRRAFENLILQIPGLVTVTGGGAETDPVASPALATHAGLTTGAHGGIVASTDPRLTDARAPTAHKTSHEPGGSDALTGLTNASIAAAAGIAKTKLANLDVVNADVNAAAAIAESKLNLATDAAAATGSRRTLGTGATQAAAGNDARFTDARTPTAHATSHQPGGTDAMAVDAAAATGSLRTIGTGALQATAGNDARLSNARTPTAHAASHISGAADALTGNLDAVGRSNVKKAGTTIGTRRGLNFIEGSNVTITVADDAVNEEVDVTIASSAAGGGAPSLVSSLPGSPTDGQEIYYLADATNGIVWHLRFRSASASTFKWEFLGGAAMISEVVTSANETTTSTTYTTLTTAGPSITVPLAGEYDVTTAFLASHSAVGGLVAMSYAIGATAAVDADAATSFVATAGTNLLRPERTRRKTLAAGNALAARYKASAGTLTVWGTTGAAGAGRFMMVRPVRVG